MKLLWIAFSGFQPDGKGGLTSDMASARYRILLPVAELNRRRHQISLASVIDNAFPPDLLPALACDAVIFSKSFSPVNEQLALRARAQGARVIVDLCDNHFDHPAIGPHYRNMAATADMLTCSTDDMAEIARRHTRATCEVIEDPYEGTRREPRFMPGDVLKLLWFGHPANLDSLTQTLPALTAAAKKSPLSLTVVTKSQGTLDADAFCRDLAFRAGFAVAFTPWSLAAQQQAMRDCDLVIIPSIRNEKKRVKSPNRMVEPLLAGRMVVANPVPSYAPFKEWAWIGDDIGASIAFALTHRQEIPGRITAAQTYIEKRFSPEIIGERWEHVLTSAIAAGRTAQAQSGLR